MSGSRVVNSAASFFGGPPPPPTPPPSATTAEDDAVAAPVSPTPPATEFELYVAEKAATSPAPSSAPTATPSSAPLGATTSPLKPAEAVMFPGAAPSTPTPTLSHASTEVTSPATPSPAPTSSFFSPAPPTPAIPPPTTPALAFAATSPTTGAPTTTSTSTSMSTGPPRMGSSITKVTAVASTAQLFQDQPSASARPPLPPTSRPMSVSRPPVEPLRDPSAFEDPADGSDGPVAVTPAASGFTTPVNRPGSPVGDSDRDTEWQKPTSAADAEGSGEFAWPSSKWDDENDGEEDGNIDIASTTSEADRATVSTAEEPTVAPDTPSVMSPECAPADIENREEWQGKTQWQVEGPFSYPEATWVEPEVARPAPITVPTPSSTASGSERSVLARLQSLEDKLTRLVVISSGDSSATPSAAAAAAAAASTPPRSLPATTPTPLALDDIVLHARQLARDDIASPKGSLEPSMAVASLGQIVQRLTQVTSQGSDPAASPSHHSATTVSITPTDVEVLASLVSTISEAQRERLQRRVSIGATLERRLLDKFTSQPSIFSTDTQHYVRSLTSPKASASTSSRLGAGAGAGVRVSRRASSGSTASLPASILHLHAKQLDSISTWNFPIFDLPGSSTDALISVGLACITRLELPADLLPSEDVLHSFLRALGDAYLDNPYHNALHAADVCQSLFFFLSKSDTEAISDEAALVALLAALAHDVGHPGLTNNFLTATSHPLAITYNDKSVLENMHAATAFQIMSSGSEERSRDVFSVFSTRELRSQMRTLMIELILHTDNALHFDLVHSIESRAADGPDALKPSENPADVTLFLQAALHCADVSNPSKEWETYNRWTERIVEEFWAQGDQERAAGLPIIRMNNREDPLPVPNMQAGFIHVLVQPLYLAFANLGVCDVSEPVSMLQANLERWETQIAAADGAATSSAE